MRKTYGKILFGQVEKFVKGKKVNASAWVIEKAEPHISIKLKNIFQKIAKSAIPPYYFDYTPEMSHDLQWFMTRYPLEISDADKAKMLAGKKSHISFVNEMERILLPEYIPRVTRLKEGFEARDYQMKARDLAYNTKRLLIGDDMGLGKTLSATLLLLEKNTLPAAVVMQAHLPYQWREEIEKFTDLKVHFVKVNKPYDLPKADVYILKYSCLSGWTNVFEQGIFKTVIFDEVQELRRSESMKYSSAKVLSQFAEWVIGLSGTPIYNYGDEIFNILNLIKPGCLGFQDAFLREWCGGHSRRVEDPKALGAYLRENFLFLRRTRQDVGRELPVVNRIVHTIPYDHNEVERSEEIARKLAIQVMSGATFMERGMAARELDVYLRQVTGVAKARFVAEYVKILLENGEPVVLAGWHREVYSIWMRELAEYNPVMYTGSESPKQKRESKEKFVSGEAKVFIISLRSGVGLNDLQKVCKTVVIGELDWSPKVHDQVITRVDRDGQQEQVTAIFLVCDYGSDPVVIDLIGEKASQSHNIINPFATIEEVYSDESRIKILAQRFLNKQAEKQAV